MSDENKSRRCSFELFPDERTGDKIADELIANEKLKERGRFMRAMLVTGAAFAAIDKRLPLLISELLTENTTLDDINKVISSVIPGAFSVEKKLLELLEKQSGLHTSVDCSTPLTEQSLSRNYGEDQTRRNADISRFICHSGAVPRPANHTFPFPDWFSSSSVFINFSLFLWGWISSNNPGCAIPDGVKSASMTPAFI